MRAESERAGSLRQNHSTKNVKTIVPKYCNSKFSSTGYERAEKMIVPKEQNKYNSYKLEKSGGHTFNML